MRNLLNLTMVAIVAAALTGCQCCDTLMQFEACKNDCLFGWLRGDACAPACAPTCAPTLAPACAPADPCAVQYGQPVVAPYAADCYGGTTVMAAPACPGGCATTLPGQTMIIPGQTVVTPGTTLAPTPVPTLMP